MTSPRADQLVTAVPGLATEPLVGSFYAWLHCVSPATGALRLKKSQLPTLESYLEAPEDHARAAADPATRGGQFVEWPADRFPAIEALQADLAAEDGLLSLADALGQLDRLLEEADGHDLAPIYERLPGPLRGVVELVYDRRHSASALLIEPLVYRRYDPSRREGMYLSVPAGDIRPFVLSTPRLSGDDGVALEIPLADPVVDVIARSRFEAVPFGQILDAAGPGPEATGVLQKLFVPTPDPLEAAEHQKPDGVRVRYLGHASLLVESRQVSILVDPFISSRAADDRYSFSDLPPVIDYCLITHGHADHFVLESLLALRHRIRRIVVPKNIPGELFDPSLALCLRHVGFKDVIEVSGCDVIGVPGGTIVAWPFNSEHGDLPIAAKSTYLLKVDGRSVYVGADTRPADPVLLEMLKAEHGPADHVFLGMECAGAPMTWVYGPLFGRPVPRSMATSRRLSGSNAADAMAAVEALGARHAYVYAMGEEPWLQHVMATNYDESSYQMKQIAEFERLAEAASVSARHLYGRAQLQI